MNLKRIIAASCCTLLAMGCLLAGCTSSTGTSQASSAAQSSAQDTRTVTDSSGNDVTIPATVTKVAPAIGAFAQVTEMLTQGNGKIVAAPTQQISDYFKQICPDYTQTNPNNYNTTSIEDIIASGAQVVYGPSTVYSDEQLAQLKAAGISYVNLSNVKTVDGMCESILTIGQILGDSEYAQAQKFVAYYKAGMADATKRTAGLSTSQKKSVLEIGYNGGSYNTVNSTDICNEYLVAAGTTNVAADYAAASSGNALTVSSEQIATWNADVILCTSQAAKDAIMADAALAQCKAIQNNTVYVIPTGIYLWSVRSGEGAMMTPWIGTVVYPDLFSDVNMTSIVKDFFATYYNDKNVSDADVAKILAGSATTSSPR